MPESVADGQEKFANAAKSSALLRHGVQRVKFAAAAAPEIDLEFEWCF